MALNFNHGVDIIISEYTTIDAMQLFKNICYNATQFAPHYRKYGSLLSSSSMLLSSTISTIETSRNELISGGQGWDISLEEEPGDSRYGFVDAMVGFYMIKNNRVEEIDLSHDRLKHASDSVQSALHFLIQLERDQQVMGAMVYLIRQIRSGTTSPGGVAMMLIDHLQLPEDIYRWPIIAGARKLEHDDISQMYDAPDYIEDLILEEVNKFKMIATNSDSPLLKQLKDSFYKSIDNPNWYDLDIATDEIVDLVGDLYDSMDNPSRVSSLGETLEELVIFIMGDICGRLVLEYDPSKHSHQVHTKKNDFNIRRSTIDKIIALISDQTLSELREKYKDKIIIPEITGVECPNCGDDDYTEGEACPHCGWNTGSIDQASGQTISNGDFGDATTDFNTGHIHINIDDSNITRMQYLGSYDTIEQLKAAHPNPGLGDSYRVQGLIYFWNEEDWISYDSNGDPIEEEGD